MRGYSTLLLLAFAAVVSFAAAETKLKTLQVGAGLSR